MLAAAAATDIMCQFGVSNANTIGRAKVSVSKTKSFPYSVYDTFEPSSVNKRFISTVLLFLWGAAAQH